MLFDPIFYQKRQVNFPDIPAMVLPKLDTLQPVSSPSINLENTVNEEGSDTFQRAPNSADLLKSVDTKPSSYLSYTYSPTESQRFKFEPNNKILYSPFKDMENIYAAQQTSYERLSNAWDTYQKIAQDNALLGFKSLYAGIRDKDYKALSENEFVTDLARTMENIDIENPIFVSARERENGLDWSTWMYKTAPQAGFTVGAITDMLLTDAALTLIGAAAGLEGGPVGAGLGATIGAATGIIRGGTRIYNGIKDLTKLAASGKRLSEVMNVARVTNSAIQAGNYVRQAATLANVGKLSAFTAKGILMSNSEAALEREMYFRAAKEEFLKDFKIINGYDASEEDINKASQKLAVAANEIYAANLALLTVSNMIQFPSIIRGSVGRKLIQSVPLAFKKEAGQLVAKGLNTKKFLFQKGTDLLTGAVSEGLEEWGQEIIAETSKDYYRNTVNGRHTVASRLDSIKKSVEDNLSDKGLDVFLSGAVIGSGFSTVGAITDYTGVNIPFTKMTFKQGARSLAKQYSEAINKEGFLFNAAVRDANIAIDIDNAAKSQDQFKLNNAMHERLFNWVTTAVKTDTFDLRMSEIEDLKDLSLDDFTTLATGKDSKTLAQEGIEFTEQDKNQYINNLISRAKNIKATYKAVETAFSFNPYKKTAVDKLMQSGFTKEQASNVADNLWEDYKYILANTISSGENVSERKKSLEDKMLTKMNDPILSQADTLAVLTSSNVKASYLKALKEEYKLVKDGILPSDIVKAKVIESLLTEVEKANSFQVFDILSKGLNVDDQINLQDIGRMNVYLQAVEKGNSINNLNKQKKEFGNLVEQLILIKNKDRKVESTNNPNNPSEVQVTTGDGTTIVTTEDELEEVQNQLDTEDEQPILFTDTEIQFHSEQNLSESDKLILNKLVRSNTIKIDC